MRLKGERVRSRARVTARGGTDSCGGGIQYSITPFLRGSRVTTGKKTLACAFVLMIENRLNVKEEEEGVIQKIFIFDVALLVSVQYVMCTDCMQKNEL